MSTIKAGDVVRLKSGGPAMTVESTDGKTAMCRWFHDKKAESRNFQVVALELDDEPDSIDPDEPNSIEPDVT